MSTAFFSYVLEEHKDVKRNSNLQKERRGLFKKKRTSRNYAINQQVQANLRSKCLPLEFEVVKNTLVPKYPQWQNQALHHTMNLTLTT